MADPSAAQKRMLARMGLAMPDGSYYIRNGSVGASDLDNAIHAVGRGVAAGDDGDAIRRHIMKRADALKLSSKIPDTWSPDGSLKHNEEDAAAYFAGLSVEEQAKILQHFGVRGMKWGQRKAPAGPPSSDHAKVQAIKAKVKAANGIHTLSNEELQTLTNRLSLESNYHRLTGAQGNHVTNGEKYVRDNIGRVKTAVDAYNTGKQVYTISKDIHKALQK
jgi:hypothetical protein